MLRIKASLVFKIKAFHKLLNTSPVFRAFFLFYNLVFNPCNSVLFNQMNRQHRKLIHFTLTALDNMYSVITALSVFVFCLLTRKLI
jgi:uncharacterized protein YybS (DUF2232 family)